jgi:hypothetical protein
MTFVKELVNYALHRNNVAKRIILLHDWFHLGFHKKESVRQRATFQPFHRFPTLLS